MMAAVEPLGESREIHAFRAAQAMSVTLTPNR